MTANYNRFLLIFIFCAGSLLFCQKHHSVQVKSLSIEEKVNGTIITLGASDKIDSKDVVTWSALNNWFYVTIYHAEVDTQQILNFMQTGIVKKVETKQLDESVQFSFQLNHPVVTVEIFFADLSYEIQIYLRLPLTIAGESIEKLAHVVGEELTIGDSDTPLITAIKTKLPPILMLSGSGFVAAGLLDQSRTYFIIGAAMVVSGYLLKKNSK